MKPKQSEQLVNVMRAKFDAQRAEFEKILAKEAELRQALVHLSEQGNKSGHGEDAFARHRSGAEIAWRKWSGQRRSAINHDLANVLVLKALAQKRLAVDFGRVEAMKSLQNVAAQSFRKDRERRRTNIAFADIILRAR